MIVEYRFQLTAICPADHKPDIYQVVVRATRTIPVEEILAAAAEVAKTSAFQEDITQTLHRALAAEVETTGTHSGVETKATCR